MAIKIGDLIKTVSETQIIRLFRIDGMYNNSTFKASSIANQDYNLYVTHMHPDGKEIVIEIVTELRHSTM